jgi:ATP citrate (pro-S)-lyase
LITAHTDLEALPDSTAGAVGAGETTVTTTTYSWLKTTPLVVKPDQLIKRRGKAGLVGINLDWPGVQEWIGRRMDQEIQVESATGTLDHFIVETFVAHAASDEYYVCIQSDRDGNELLFYS